MPFLGSSISSMMWNPYSVSTTSDSCPGFSVAKASPKGLVHCDRGPGGYSPPFMVDPGSTE